MKDYFSFQSRILSARVISAVAKPIYRKLSVRLPDLLTVLLLEFLIGLVGALVWGVTKVTRAPFAELWAAWGCLFSALCLFLVKANLNRFLSIMNQYASAIFGSKQLVFDSWMKIAFDIRRQVIVSAIFAVIFFPITLLFFQIAIGRAAILIVSYILYFCGFYFKH